MIIKFITVNAILLLSSLINAKDKCVIIEGCLSCVENTNNQIQCTKCDIDYQLDTEKNICIYSKCSNYQFYDKNQYDGTEESGCVAICNTSSQQDEKINLCKSQQQCNTSKLSQQIIQENANLTDFFIYQNDYYVAQNKGSFFIYNRADASFIKNIKFLDQDVFVFQINSRIFIKGNDNSLSTWDIMNDFRKSILYQNLISFKSLKQINFIFNRYVIVQNIQQQQIEFQIFYDELDQAFSLSNSFTIKMNAKVAQLIDKYVFIQNLYYLQIYQIKVNYDEKNQLKLQLEFLFEQLQDEKFISFIAGAYTGIYYLAAERAVYEINITTNSYMMIANTNFINKIKLFQASGTSDSHYLIIKNDNQSLFLVNLQNHSQQLIINSLYLDFEICNLWGQQNQLIVLVNNLQLQFYELDESLQQFILSEQKYILNYEAVIINLIKYINQSSSMNQIMYEIAILSLQAIQIIKQGTLQQQERKLASVQIISNMKIPFPLTLLENNKNSGSERQILIYQYPPLIIQPFGVNQIIFYDLHENNNRFQKNIILLSDYVEKIDKFTANKIIALTRSQLITIDIFTKEVKQISWWYGNYLINYDRIMIFNEHRYMVCTSEMDRLFEQFIQIGKFVFFNYDQPLRLNQQQVFLGLNSNLLQLLGITNLQLRLYFDISEKNITQISGKNYIDESVSIQYFVQLQYIKNPTNTKMIGFSGGKALIYTALFQNNKYYKLDLGDYKMEYYTRLQTHAQSGKYFIYNYNSIYQFDMFNDSQSQIVVKDIHLEAMYIYDKFLIYNDKGIVFINLFTNKKSIFQDMNIINGIIYDSQNNIYYVYGSKILILNNQLAITQIIIEENTDTNCYNCINFEKKVIFYCIINNQFSIVIIDKTYKKYQTFIPDSSQQFLFDEKYEHIYCSNQVQNIKIYSFQGVLKKVINENVMNCKICSQQKVICYLLELATFIDRQTLEYKMIDIRDGPGYMYIQFCIEKLNYLIFTNLKYQDTLSVYDISASKIVLSYSLIKQNSLNDTKIIDIIYDESSIRYFMYLDSEGTFYLSSIDPKLPFQSFVKINEFNDQQEQIQRFVYDGIANDVYISSNKSIYKLDYNLLGSQFEPLINYPQTLIAQISISGKETDYLIVNNNSTLLRYTQQQLKFELALSNDSRIVEIKYNQSTDTLIIGLEDSILFYQKYQQTKKDNIFPIFYKLQNVNLQQFITNYVVIACDSKILHLNIEQGFIIKKIQFNSTQLVSSFAFNKNQDLILVGFSDGQLLQYNLVSQIYSFYNTTQYDSLQNQITNILFIEISGVQQFAYAITNGALLYQIDTMNIKIVSQIDLRHLVNEDPSLSLAHFINDYTYQRYIFCFSGQKKAYVWNYSNNQQEQNLFLPKIKVNKFEIEQNFVYIQCSYQVNLYTLGPKIQLFTVVKKDFIEDKITLFKLFANNIFSIFYIDKFELFLLNETKITMIAQQSYQYPQMLSYQLDSKSSKLTILGLDQTRFFNNIYNLDIYFKEQISECTALISSKNYEFIKQELSYISPKQKEAFTIKGISLIDEQNWESQVYLKLSSKLISNVFQQISQLNKKQFTISPIDIQDNAIALKNDTFQNLGQETLKLLDFNFNFENNTNLFINITQNQFTKQIIIQNMTINLNSISSNQIYISNIEKVIFQDIKLSYLNLQESNQQNSLIFLYNVSQVFMYNLQVSYNSFFQKNQQPIFQFELIKNILIKGITSYLYTHISGSKNIKYQEKTQALNTKKKEYNQMINKFITVNIILLLLNLINANDQCVLIEGCVSCIENTNNQIQCTKCDIDYQLDTEKNICIYSKCSNYQFYDKNQYDGTEESGCVAICNTSSQQDEKINLCKSQQQCNTSKLSQQIIQENANITDFFIYQNDYYVAQNQGSFFIYNRADASFIKNIKFLDQDVFVFQINSRIFIKGNDNSLSTWDIMNDFRKSILYQNLISFKSLKQINFIFNRYVIVQNIQIQYIEFQIFYDELDQAFSLSNSFTIEINAKVAQLIDKYVFIQNLYYLQIYQIKVNYDEKNQLNLQLEFLFEQFQDNKFISFIAGAYTGIYYFATERSVYELNITKNHYMLIGKIDFINKLKLFQASGTSDSHYLIIKNENDDQCLFLVNLQNNSQQLIINSLYLDFEICNLWGQQNQLIVLVNNLQLQFYELDESSQQFILSEQKYILSYRAVIINLIKYINQSSSMNQIMYEIAILGLQSIQIIKQGTLQQQERKLASVQIISNMKIPFPLTLLEKVNSYVFQRQILIYQYPPLIIQPFGVNQIIFYDLHENNNRFQKNIILLSDYVEKIDKFTTNKIIALTRNQLITIDIFTKEVKQISWWYGNYLINYDRIMIFYENRYIVYTSEMDRLFEQFIKIGKFVFFNYDQVIFFDDHKLCSLNLQNQEIQILFEIKEYVQNIQILKKFSSLQDQTNNKYSQDQILIYCNDQELQIYSQDFTLIYQKSKLPISNIESMDRIMNEDYSYLLKGNKEFVIIEIQQNTQTFLYYQQLKLQGQIIKKVNLNGKTYYSTYLSINNQLFEYFIDIQRNITQISGKNYIDESVQMNYFAQLQYIKNPTNTKMIGFQGDNPLIYTALFQNNKYYKLDLGDYKMNKYAFVKTHAQSGKYFIYNSNSIYQFDMFNDSQSQIVVKDIRLEGIDIYDKFLIYQDQGIVFINLFTNEKSIFQDMNIINGIIYDSQNNIYYVYGSQILILNNQLAITQIIIEDNTDTNCDICINFEKKVIFQCRINNQFSIVIIDKIYKNYQTLIPDQNTQQILIDEKYEHIYCYDEFVNIKIYSFQGILKKVINENVMGCYICSQQKVICYLMELATFIDRQTLEYKMIDIRDGPGNMLVKFCIEKLNYLIFTNLNYQDTLSVYDISASKIVLSYSVIKQNSLKDKSIIYSEYDENSIRYFMYLDSEGTFYLSSIDPKLPFQSFVKINEFNDQQEQIKRFVYDGIANDVYIISDKSIYKLDYNLLGSQFEPLINYPQTLIAQISISGKETDYLIVNNNSILLRYTQQQVKFELALSNDSRIVEIKYNQSTDTLIIGLEDSILFYQKYQQTKKDNIFPIFYKLQNVNLQQFITNYVVIACDSKILHLNIEQGFIIKKIQFNSTQLVSSFAFNKNQDIILVGFSDGQLLQYNLVSQIYSFYNTTQYDSLQNQITNILFIEISGVQQFAYAITNGALLYQIDTMNIKIVSQIDLRHLVNEDPSLSLAHFINDYTYQRYIFSFSGQKKAYVWNYSNNQQEQNLFLPKIKVNKFEIEQNFVYIQCSYQVNLYTLGPKIQLFTVVKKDFIEDKIILFKLFTNNIFSIFFINKFELFLLNGTKITMIAQQSYQYPQMLSYQLDSKSSKLTILGLDQTRVFNNIYNLDIYFKESISECTALISSKNYEFIKQELSYISPKQKEIFTIKGISLIDEQNWESQLYLKFSSKQISNYFQQISQLDKKLFTISPIDIQDNAIILKNDTFQNLGQETLKLLDFNFNFENNTNLFINITQNQFTKQIIIQNMTIYLKSISSNQIYISNIEKKPIQLKIDKKLPQVPYNASINNDNNFQVLSPIAADSQQRFI
ncbi:hypothetical protein ABPG73_008023 [Tetrahymena malaccensis]